VICRSAYKGKQSQPHAWWHAVAETTGAEESCAERQAEPAATVINCHQPPPCYVCGRPTTPCRPTAGADCTVRIMVEPVSSASKHAYRVYPSYRPLAVLWYSLSIIRCSQSLVDEAYRVCGVRVHVQTMDVERVVRSRSRSCARPSRSRYRKGHRRAGGHARGHSRCPRPKKVKSCKKKCGNRRTLYWIMI